MTVDAKFDIAVRRLDVGLFSGFEDYGGVGFSKEYETDDGVEGADDGENPEDPAPA